MGYGSQPYGLSPYGLPAIVSDTGGLGGGSLPARRRGTQYPTPVALPEIIRFPSAVAGKLETVQLPPVSAARASLQFVGAGIHYQVPQGMEAFGEMIDTEFEMMSAIFMEVAALRCAR